MGSSCFARGNNLTVINIQQIIKERNWEFCVVVKGVLCQGLCKQGPTLKVNGITYNHIDTASLVDIIEEEVKR